mgnify:CR=1 FL=1
MTLRRIVAPPIAELSAGIPVLVHLEPLGFDTGGLGFLTRATFVDEGRQRDAVWFYRIQTGAWDVSINSIVSAGLEGRRVDLYEVSTAGSGAGDCIVHYRETDADPRFPVDRIAVIRSGKLLDADLLVSVTGETANASIDRILATPDGRFVAIQTQASNLLAGADLDTNDCADIYLVDRVSGAITRVSIANGLEAAADAQLEDIRLGSDGALSIAFSSRDASLSSLDHNALDDVFVWRLPAANTVTPGVATISLLSAIAGQAQGGNGALLSARGVNFVSESASFSALDVNGVADVWTVASGATPSAVLPQALSASGGMALADIDASGNRLLLLGRSASFGLGALTVDQLALADLRTGTLSALSLSALGAPADDAVLSAVLSANGAQAAFSTAASNLLPESGDSPGVSVYLYTPDQGASIQGGVSYWKTGAPVAGARVSARDLEGATAGITVASDQSDAGGLVRLEGLEFRSYQVSVVRPTLKSDWADAVSAADVLAALKMACGRNPNSDPDGSAGSRLAPSPSAFQFIAADADADGRVTRSDAAQILRMALTSSQPSGPDWRLFDAAAELGAQSRTAVSWPGAETLDASTSPDMRWVGVLPGDVDGNWQPALDPLLNSSLATPTY